MNDRYAVEAGEHLTMKATKIEIWESRGDWYFHAVSRNGRIIAQSEGYTRKQDAKRGALRAFPDAKVVCV